MNWGLWIDKNKITANNVKSIDNERGLCALLNFPALFHYAVGKFMMLSKHEILFEVKQTGS